MAAMRGEIAGKLIKSEWTDHKEAKINTVLAILKNKYTNTKWQNALCKASGKYS